ncbi:MAG: hypothetical protein K2P39_00010 [Lachnospiraceae bacterium]|nr:hypothetical protein [Lachnospiraceae bacterium]
MISVFLSWLYIAATAFLVGYGLCALVHKTLNYPIRDIGCIVAVGLMTVTVYAQIFSLFYKVGAAANAVLVVVCAVTAVLERRRITEALTRAWSGRSVMWKLSVVLGAAVWCFCTSRGYMHYDSDLYHAQSIRWIEEYGVVKGLGNLHVRFAYNSSFFALSALYSMKFLTGRSLHTVNGFMALLLWVQVLPLFCRSCRKGQKRTVVTDFARLGALYYLTVIYSDIVAPASDYAIMCVVFFIVIRWLELLEKQEDSAVPYALLCVAAVYAVTLKLTAGLILLLLAKPVSMLVREKNWRDTGIYLAMGIVTAVPWLARTVLISGYLLYPFPALDLFDVDWKIDAAKAALDAAEIRTWGRGLNNAALADLPMTQWFSGWFGALPATGKLLVTGDLVCVAVFVILAVSLLCRRRSAERLLRGQILVLAAVLVSYGFWQFSAPLLRYGYAYVLLTVTITSGILCDILTKSFDKWQKKDMIRKITVFGICALWAFSAVKLTSLARYCCGKAGEQRYVWQQDYGSYALESYVVEDVTFYYPVQDDRVGYDSFPAIPRPVKIQFRGASVAEGFYPDREER